MSTKVRLTDAEIFPHHTTDEPLLKPDVWARYRGGIVIIGRPEKPQSHWFCGTDVVFPVLGVAELQVPEKESGAKPYGYLCRHQIQAGD